MEFARLALPARQPAGEVGLSVQGWEFGKKEAALVERARISQQRGRRQRGRRQRGRRRKKGAAAASVFAARSREEPGLDDALALDLDRSAAFELEAILQPV